jgi:hypothetical protein
MKTIEQIAFEIGNSITSVKDIVCPRGVVNPGLYFGAILALKELERSQKESYMSSVEQAIEKHKHALNRLKDKNG